MNFRVHYGTPDVSTQPSPFRPNFHGPSQASDREEWNSLSQETDPQLRSEAMLQFARRQEESDHFDTAAAVYGSLLETAPEAGMRERARGRLDAMLGRGDLGSRAEFLMRRFARQASDPSTLLAMGVAGAVFRMTRLATLSRLSATPTPGFLTRFLGTGRAASLAGFALEAPTFTLASRLGNEALGSSQAWDRASLGRDLASSYLVLGGLRLAGWASAASYQRLASTPLQGRGLQAATQTLFQQGGMLTGILLGHRLEQWAGLRRPQEGGALLIDSLATLLQFHVAGNLSRQAFGSRWQAWERGLDSQGAGLMEGLRLPEFPVPENALAWASPGTVSRPLAGPRQPRGPEILMMVGDGEGKIRGEGSGPPSADTTQPFRTEARPATAEAEGELRDPLEVESAAQLMRRMNDPDLNFREALLERDLEFRFKAPNPELGTTARIERSIPSILQFLNAIAIGKSIPAGRRVVIVQDGEGWGRFSLIRGEKAFECHPPLPETAESAPARPSPPPPPSAEAERNETNESEPPKSPGRGVVSPLAPKAEAETAKLSAEEEEARSIPLRTLLVESLPRVLELAGRQFQRRGTTGPVLLETGSVDLPALETLETDFVQEIPAGTLFKLYVSETRQTFRGTAEEGRLRWASIEDKGWDHSTIFSATTVRSVIEAYQALLAHSRSESPSSGELTLRFRGATPSRDFLGEFVASTLDRFPIPGRDSIRFELGGEEAPLVFTRGADGRWSRE
ncbi:MAG: hypothetical protein K8R69_11985 [Deltaproteobacteria bacterium]|nr:hypothetical protein [Deltaproteobacteria bacterium]